MSCALDECKGGREEVVAMTKRVVLWIAAAILILGGGAIAVGGGALMAVFGTDSTASSGTHTLQTSTAALVAPIDDISDTNGVATVVGQPRLRMVADASQRPVFIGIGRAADVDRYLAGVAVDRVTDFELTPYRLTTVRQNGTRSASPPTAQKFWVARATSSATATLRWKIQDGNYRVVLMNADGTPGVSAGAAVSLRVPKLFAIGVGILVAGLVIALFGALLAVLAVRARPRRATPLTQTAAVPGQAQPVDDPSLRSSAEPAADTPSSPVRPDRP
jgi:hypothetical protein